MFKAKKKDGNTVNFIEDFDELAKVILVITNYCILQLCAIVRQVCGYKEYN